MIGSSILSAFLFLIAGLHFYWSRGGLWPGESTDELIATVIGDPRLKAMPPAWVTQLVALAIALAGATALALAFEISGPVDKLVGYAGAGFCAVFGIRGVIGFLPFFKRAHSREPFLTLNKLMYSPACVLVAEGFFSLASPRF